MTLDEVKAAFRQLPYARLVEFREGNSPDSFRLLTATHSYHITCRDDYLGCIASSRKPREGETWTRGNDLPDGPADENTLAEIVQAMLGYELSAA